MRNNLFSELISDLVFMETQTVYVHAYRDTNTEHGPGNTFWGVHEAGNLCAGVKDITHK